MARNVVSRTQRRMEKKQAMVLLVLVLAVSLVSFTLGVMVGRSGSPEIAKAQPNVPARVPVAREKPTAGTQEAPKQSRETLTYYDSLSKGEPSPLGSGINLPPEDAGKKDKTAAKDEEPVKKEPVATRETAFPPPPAATEGTYVVQVASFQGAEDARKLQQRLAGKDYAAFVESADLKEKGVWHRVFVGPYTNSEGAGEIVARLKAEENLAGLVRKR